MNGKKTTNPVMQLLVLLLIMLGCFMLSLVLTAVLAISGIDVQSSSNLLWIQGVTSAFIFIVPTVLMVTIYYRHDAKEFLKLDFGGRRWLLALVGIVVLLLITPVNEWLTEWNDSWNLGRVGEMLRNVQEQSEATLKTLVEVDSVGGLLANLLVIALLPAICEELFFRGGVQNLMQRWVRNPHVAIWITAVIFSIGHGEIFSFMPRLLLGALLGYLYVYGGSMVLNMVAHFFNNALVVVLYWLVARGTLDIDPEMPIGFSPVVIACSTLAAVALMWVTFFSKKLKNSAV